jgi:hypothetical protein
MRARLAHLGLATELAPDIGVTSASADDVDLVVVSKSVKSANITDTFRTTTAGVLTWEDNLQIVDFMGFTTATGKEGTAWHHITDTVWVNPAAPAALRGGQSGVVDFYAAPADVTWSPPESLGERAITVAESRERGDGRWACYAYERGSRMADGVAAGRRYYFGLYDGTFGDLAPAGLALFDAAVRWTASATDAVTHRPALRFGLVPVNEPTTRRIAVTNTGTRRVKVVRAAVEPPRRGFRVRTARLPIAVPPGATRTLTVRFLPRAARRHRADLLFTTRGVGRHDHAVVLRGRGVSGEP